MHLCWKLALMMMVLVCVTKQDENMQGQPRSKNLRLPARVDVSCCKEVSKGRIPPDYKVTGYNHQSALGPCVEAIIFYTDKGKFCFDPNARWIKQKLEDLAKNEKQ